jgi:hypothetical protein
LRFKYEYGVTRIVFEDLCEDILGDELVDLYEDILGDVVVDLYEDVLGDVPIDLNEDVLEDELGDEVGDLG